MMYCEKCCVVFPEERCPVCGRKKVRAPKEDDLCLIAEKEMIWCEVLEDALKERGIPYLTKGKMGAGLALKVGPMFEKTRFYVPYARYEEAAELTYAVFAEGTPVDPDEDQSDDRSDDAGD